MAEYQEPDDSDFECGDIVIRQKRWPYAEEDAVVVIPRGEAERAAAAIMKIRETPWAPSPGVRNV